jgi:hypothetical protein
MHNLALSLQPSMIYYAFFFFDLLRRTVLIFSVLKEIQWWKTYFQGYV